MKIHPLTYHHRISVPYILHGLCEDYLTCDIAFNAVMPLSCVSTRGRYSRIEGVTVSHHICLVLAAALPHYLFLPISLNSLDLAGVRLLSPRGSQILPNQS